MTHMTIKKTMLESILRFKSSKGDLLRAQGMTMAVWAACLCPLLFLLNASLRPLALRRVQDRKSTRLNSSHRGSSRMPSSA